MKLRQLITTLALAVGFTATAATPVAVWDGDFKTTTKGAYTLTTGTGHTVAADGSTITIGNTATTGVKVSGGDIYTIVVKARGYTPASSGNPEVIVAMLKNTASQVGLGAKNDKKGWYIWNNGAWGDAHVTSSAIINDTNSHKYTLSYANPATGSITQGTTMFMDNTQLTADTSLRDKDLAKATAVTIGGPQSGSLAVAKGLVIEGIAIFDSTVPTATAAKYHFPSSPVRTISINFGSGSGSVSGTYGIVPSSTWNNYSDATKSTAVSANVSDGSTVSVKWWAKNTYYYTSVTDEALKGYLDDGACGDGTTGNGAHIAIMGIPFAYYDVIIYYATDTENWQFNPVAIKKWTQQSQCGDQADAYDGSVRKTRNDSSLKFGKSRNATAVIGTNVSYLKRCFNYTDLDIKAGQNDGSSSRGGIAAIQIVECDPHTSEMYFNRLAGDEVTIPAGTYGNIKTPAPIKATQYTGSAPTALALSGSTEEIGGDAQYIQGLHCNTRTHMISGWFRCDGLDSEKMLYAAIAHKGGDGGYKVTVDANGAINVGKCNYYAWNGTALKSANGVIEANKWYYITVAVDSAKPDAATATAKVCVNGAAIAFPTGTFATNLNGSDKCAELSIGQGVSAAGLYVDFSATGEASLSASLATNEKYLFIKKADYTLDMTQDASSSTATWSPERTGALYPVDTLTVNDIADSAVTLTFDENVAVKKITATSEAGKELTLAANEGKSVSATEGFDFSGAAGKVTVGFDTDTAPIAAGADTVLNGTGTGTLTIGENQKATVKNWQGANLAGAGTVVFNADAAGTAVTPGAFANGFTGLIKLTQGTWTCSDNYPERRPVTLSGANAKFVLNKQDGMGYGNNLPAFTVENGATFEVDKRDTFNRNLVLNNGKLVLKQDDLNSGRSFDFYGSATVTVSGTSTIGGLTAGSTTASGILSVRRDNFVITVNEGGLLKCYSQWRKDAGNGAFTKSGIGTWEQYRNAHSSATFAFTLGAGTLKLVNGGEVTKSGMTLSADTTLELNATDAGSYTAANAITGAGAITKTGTGTYALTGANTYEGTTTVLAGTLKVADGATLGTGDYTVAEGATLDFGTNRTATVAGASAGTVQIKLTDDEKGTLEEEGSIDAFNVSGDAFGGTVVASDSTGAEYEINFNVVDGKLVVTKKTGAKTSPFNLTVTEEDENNWELFDWKDSTPGTPQDVTGDDWAKKVAANIAVSDEVTAEMRVGTDVPITLSTLNIANGYKLTITDNNNAALTVDAIDDSASTGETTLDFNLGEAPITAGANTILNKVGTGTYTIGAEKKLTVKGSGLSVSQVSNAGTLVFAGGKASKPLAVTGNANLTATLAAGAYVKNTVNGNQVHNITGLGEGASSVYALTKASGGVGFTTAAFTNLTLVSDCAAGERLWIERMTLKDVRFVAKTTIYLSDMSPTVLSLSGAGAVTKDGNKTLTINCDKASTYSGESAVPFIIGGTAVQTLSGNYTGALTVNEGAQVKLSGSAAPSSIENAGKVIFDVAENATNTVAYAITGEGTVEIVGGGTVIFKESSGVTPDKVTETNGKALFAKTVSVNDLGKYTPVAPYTTANVIIVDAAGSILPSTVVGDHLEFEWEITGGACWWDYEFNGNLSNAGTDTTSLQFDGAHAYPGEEFTEDGELRIASAPWRNVTTWPETATFVMYGTMVGTDKTYQLGFGSTYQGTAPYYTIFLATDTVSENTVNLCITTAKNAPTVLCTMTVPNAQTAKHLYAFTLKKVNSKTVIDIYLDGELLQEYPFDTAVTLGTGFQIGSGHGGVCAGYNKASANDPAVQDWLRVYNTELSKAAIEKYALEYPYVSPNGSYQRTVTAGDVWTAENAWTKEGTTPEQADVPVAGSTVKLTVEGATTLGVNLDADVSYEAIKINGDDLTVALATGEQDGKVISAGRVTAGANVTFKYDAFTMFNAPLTVKQGKTVTFDLSMVDMTQFFTTQTYDLTGYTTLEKDANVAYVAPAELHGREISAAIDDTTKHYILTVTVPEQPFTYEAGTWKWGTQAVTAEIVSNNTALAIVVKDDLAWGMDRSTFIVSNGTLKTTAAVTADCAVTVESGAAFDLNGIQCGSASQAVGFLVTLNGGTLKNTASAQGIVKGLALGSDSTVDVASGNIWIQSGAGGYTDVTLALGDYTLAKTGDGQFGVVTTTVAGTGMIDLKAGELIVQESSNFGAAVVKVGENATVQVRDGKTLSVASIISEGGTLNVLGTVSGFDFSGAVTIANAGSYGPITNAADAVVTIGQKRGLTFAGAGTVNVTLTQAEFNNGAATLFDLADGATTKVGTVMYGDTDITGKCTFSGNQITAIDREAKIGGTFYLTFAEALNAVTDGQTVELVKNLELAARVDVTAAGKTIAIDLGGFTITRPDGSYSGNGSAFNVVSGTVTIKNGTIDLSNLTQTAEQAAVPVNECDAITVRKDAVVTLEGLTVIVNSITGADAYAFADGRITITSGTYQNLTDGMYPFASGVKAMCVNQANNTNQFVFITGGTFKGQNPAAGDDSTKPPTFVADGYYALKVESVWTVVTAPSVTVAEFPVKPAQLDAAYLYTTTDPVVSPFALWAVDFFVSFDKPINADTVALAGVGQQGWQGATLPAMAAGEEYAFVKTQYKMDMTYAALCDLAQFACGVANYSAENDGTVMKVVLRMTNGEQTIVLNETTYTLQGKKAKIGTTYYLTLNQAFEAVQENDKVELLAAAAIDADKEFAKTFTLDLNGQQLTATTATIAAGTLTLTNCMCKAPALEGSAGGFAPNGVITVADGATLDLSGLPFGTTYGGIEGTGSLMLESGATAKFYKWNYAMVDSANWMFYNYPAFFTGSTIPAGAYVWIGDTCWTGVEGRFMIDGEVATGTVTANHNIGSDYSAFDHIESFASLAAAASAIKAGTTVTLTDAASADGVALAKNATLDLNGQNLTVDSTFTSSSDLTVVNNGAATGGFFVNGTIAVAGGTLDASALAVAQGGVIPGQAGGIAVANGATFVMMNEWAGYSPNWLAANRKGFLTAADGGMVKMGSTVYTARNGLFGTENTVAKATITAYGVTYVEAFDSLAAAIAAANADTTVTLLANVTTDAEAAFEINKNITLDFATYTVEKTVANHWTFDIANGATVVFKGTTGGVKQTQTAKNLTYPASAIRNKGNLTIESGVYVSDFCIIKNDEDPGAGVLTVNGGTFNVVAAAEGFADKQWALMNWGEATVNGGTWNGTIGTRSCDRNSVSKAGATEITAALQGEVDYLLYVGYPGDTTWANLPKIKGVAKADVDLEKNASVTADLELVEAEGWVTVAPCVLPLVKVEDYDGEQPAGLDAAFTYTITNTPSYLDWNVDYFVSFSKDIKADTVTLKGQYDLAGEAWIGQTIGVPLSAGTTIQLVPSFTTKGVTVGELLAIQPFNCGVGNSDVSQTGTVMTVVLKMFKEGEEDIVLDTTTYTFEAKGPTPAPGSQVDVEPVPGHENTYVVTPTAEAKDVVIQGVKDGDTLIVNGTEVDTLTVNNTNDVIITVMNKANDYDITGAVYGFRPKPVVKKLAMKGLKMAAAEAKEVFTFSTELDPEMVNLDVSGITVGTNVQIGVSAYLGLSCQLLRGTEVTNVTSVLVTEGSSAVITNTPTLLIDGAMPEGGKAFYKIRVAK